MCWIYTCASGCGALPVAIVPWLHSSPFAFEKGDSSALRGAKVGKDQAPVQVCPSGTRGTAS